jgi:hypothetical protein
MTGYQILYKTLLSKEKKGVSIILLPPGEHWNNEPIDC